uniref:ATP-dependent DNA helicase n=1 Tax=Octopus bimaculoides TaxID=37653 RepID=A0A0L8HLX3_OCTBM
MKTDTIGRIPTISLSAHQSELFHLRILLHNVTGATSFDDLKSADGNVCPTFQEACLRRGLISDDREIRCAMEETASIRIGDSLREFVATMLIYYRPPDPRSFWEEWKLELAHDLMHQNNVNQLNPCIENEVLIRLQEHLQRDELDLVKNFQLPKPDYGVSPDPISKIISEEVDFDTDSLRRSSAEDATAKLFRMIDLLIVDEVIQGDKLLFECLDRSFRKIRKFVKRGSRLQIVNLTLKTSYIWKSVTKLKLSINMRIRNSSDATFASYLSDTRSRNLSSISEMRKSVFDGLGEEHTNPSWLYLRAVIASTNDVVNSIFPTFSWQTLDYISSDTVDDEKYHQYPQDFLNNLNPSGLRVHKITLKKGCPTMLLWNFDPANGHCNGTRYTVTEFNSHVIEAVIATDLHTGKRLFTPRIHLIPSDNQFPFQLRRRQFPIKLAFSFTANKSQGQTLDRVSALSHVYARPVVCLDE